MGEGQGGEVEVESSFWGEVWSSRGGVDGGNGRTSATLLYLNPTSSSAVNHEQTGFKVNSTIWN